ncbi:DHA2 family efflux MFS transporter permease subunit [Herbiconiux sp. CPCC 205763]|uniref:DHA2 family efflux MFS transporter permease subunit n=1 Tax=Herbiconiux aconitum TaxID=2970913 RepID=A0ABT2GND4_9MICO|nr:DHA2 family efflux MFS transporter permease subunit [Herbiconiux aconitum]MCS5717733.1 DHA2 family efflux MFS transporter permease subunit [Herbiconiux aconitum]
MSTAPAQGRLVIVVAVLASTVAFLDGTIVNVALPQIANELGGGLPVQQWVIDSYTLTLAAFILTAGALSDTFGRVTVLRVGLFAFGATSIACALAPDSTSLIVLRALQGLAGALLVPSSLALIASAFRGAAQTRAIGLWSAWTSAAFIGGPVLGGVLVDTVGWRWVFGVNVLPVVVTLVFLALLRKEQTSRGGKVDIVGAVLGALGLGGAVFALIEQGQLGWTHPLIIVSALIGVAALAGFVVWEKRSPHPMMPLAMFRVRNFWVGNLTTFLVWGVLWLGVFIVPVFLQQVAGYSGSIAGLATAPMTVISLVISGAVGTLAGRWGPRWFVAIGPVIAAAGYLWMTSVSDPVNIWTSIVPGVLLVGTGIAITSTPVTSTVLNAIPAAEAGIASAVNNAVARVAGLIAIAMVGTITGGVLDYDAFRRVVVFVAVVMVIGAGVAAFGIRNPIATSLSSAQTPAGQPS